METLAAAKAWKEYSRMLCVTVLVVVPASERCCVERNYKWGGYAFVFVVESAIEDENEKRRGNVFGCLFGRLIS